MPRLLGEPRSVWLQRECEYMRVRIYKRKQRAELQKKRRCQWCDGPMPCGARKSCSVECRAKIDLARRFNVRRRQGRRERSQHGHYGCIRRIIAAATKHITEGVSQVEAAREFEVSLKSVRKLSQKLRQKSDLPTQ